MNNHTSSLEISHFPVMLSEVLKITRPTPQKKFIDCTFGGGGYSREILKYSNTIVQAIDRDKKTLSIAKDLEKKFPQRFKFYQLKFSQLDKISNDGVDAIIFDLGLSSIQLDDLDRGFSFKSTKKLDMTMGLNEISALEVINNLSEVDLKSVIKILGDEKEASKIAKNIVKFRNQKKITSTTDLVKIIQKSKRKNYLEKINPCTKTFQAIRIFVNKEINELINGIIIATKKLKPGGKILVISFHSLEDRIVKHQFKNIAKNKSLFIHTKKPIIASKSEIYNNRRSKSAKLRIAEKIINA